MSPILGIYASQISGHLVTSSYESIATYTPSGTSTITFSSIPQTYTHLQIRTFTRDAGNDDSMSVRFNGDSSGTSGTNGNYSTHVLYGNGTSASSLGYTYTNYMLNWFCNPNSNGFGVGVLDILDYTNTNKYKTIRGLGGYDTNGGNGQFVQLTSGNWRNTAAINSITVYTNYNMSSGSHIALYGIKGA